MADRGHGAIVNIASIVASRSVPLHAYAPAKAAVVAITECLAAEWGPAGIRVNAVSPGHTLTPALQDAIDKGERDVATLERNNALGRMVQPVEVACAVAFLASSDAGAITGINLPVDCGWLVTGSWHSYGGLREVSGA
jgi:NAD(P)-dependent dehydrogenase (short-subunit alcohol dehydrogenase family)